MALLQNFIDSRTIAAIAAAGSASYAHGIANAPDLVIIHETSTSNTTSGHKLAWKYDATNVSVYNHGKMATEELRCVAIYFHSVVR